MNHLRRMGAENVLSEYWEGYISLLSAEHALKAFGFDGAKVMKLALAHEHRWPEKLTSYWAGKIIAKCERKAI